MVTPIKGCPGAVGARRAHAGRRHRRRSVLYSQYLCTSRILADAPRAHHATSAIHQALKRAAPGQAFALFEGCAPPKRARGTRRAAAERLEGARAANRPPPSDGPRAAGTELARVASAGWRAGRGRERRACSYPNARRTSGSARLRRRRVDAEDTQSHSRSSAFASTLIRETVSNLRSSVTAHVYWTVLDDSRTEAAANMMKAFETIARPSSQPAPSTLVVASVGAKAACAARKAGARTAAWRPPPSHIVEDDASS